jgi:hypothetical protein
MSSNVIPSAARDLLDGYRGRATRSLGRSRSLGMTRRFSSSLLTPHSSLLTPYSSLSTFYFSLLTAHFLLFTWLMRLTIPRLQW